MSQSNSTSQNNQQPVEFGFCHCGCGGKTKIAAGTSTRQRCVKGQPQRFINGHGRRGQCKPVSLDGYTVRNGIVVLYCEQRISQASDVAESGSRLILPPKHLTRFLRMVKVNPVTEYWEWQGCKRDKYGKFQLYRKTWAAHRVAYEHFVAEITPDKPEIDHVWERGCRSKSCVNPVHLEAVTRAENARRYLATLTHCPRGHIYSPENTRLKKTKTGRTRTCIICARADGKARERRRRAQPHEQLNAHRREMYHAKRAGGIA